MSDDHKHYLQRSNQEALKLKYLAAAQEHSFPTQPDATHIP